MAIVPDTKNWTWVLERECPECGFDASATDARRVAALLRENAASWPAVLAASGATVRPDDSTWSPLEYAAHVRDVYRIFRVRLGLMLTEDDPIYPNWDQDAAALEGRYAEEDPATVSHELTAAAATMADALDAVPDDAWSRTGRRSDGAQFTIDTFAKYFLHDVVHHRWDVTGIGAER
jgi:hypothetical protein